MESDAHLSPMLPTDLPTGYPESAQQWVELPTGDRILIRPIIPEDVERIAHAFEVGDVETIRNRFFTAAPPSDRPHIEYLANIDYVARFALIAIDGNGDSIGISRDETSDVSTAEVAIVVEEAWRKKGVGSVLVSALEPWAIANGITTLDAIYLPENKAVERLLASLGYEDRTLEDGIVTVTKHLA